VIDEIDAALKSLLKEEALGGSDVEVVFDAPTKDWAARRNAPMVNAFLYDVREDVRKRTRGMINEYDDAGIVIGRRLPPRFYNLSYLVTAWTHRPEDEHRLLAQMLLCFSNYEAMPPERLNGQIGSLGLPVEMRISLPPPEDRSFADVWTALGGELRPSIDVVLSVPLAPARTFTAGPPVTAPTSLTLRDVEGRAVDRDRQLFRITGEVAAEGGAAGSGASGADASGGRTSGGDDAGAAGAAKPGRRRRGMRLQIDEKDRPAGAGT
jgi:Pvc16 N-terminal domain